MKHSIPSLFHLASGAVAEQRMRDAVKVDEEHKTLLTDIETQQRRKCLYSKENQDLQRAELALARAKNGYRDLETSMSADRAEREEAAMDTYQSRKQQLLRDQDADALNQILSLKFDETSLTCSRCRGSYLESSSNMSCSTITRDGAGCEYAGPAVQHCGCEVTRCKICAEPTCALCQLRHLFLCRVRCGFNRENIEFSSGYPPFYDTTILPQAYCHRLPINGYIHLGDTSMPADPPDDKCYAEGEFPGKFDDMFAFCTDTAESFCLTCLRRHQRILYSQIPQGVTYNMSNREFDNLWGGEMSELAGLVSYNCGLSPPWACAEAAVQRETLPDFKTQQVEYYRESKDGPKKRDGSRMLSSLGPLKSGVDPSLFFDALATINSDSK